MIKSALTSDQTIGIVAGATILTILNVPLVLLGFLAMFMIIDFITAIPKVCILYGYKELNFNKFIVGLLKKLALISLVLLFGAFESFTSTTIIYYSNNSELVSLFKELNFTYLTIGALWAIALNEILSCFYNVMMLITNKELKKLNIVELIGRLIENYIFKILKINLKG